MIFGPCVVSGGGCGGDAMCGDGQRVEWCEGFHTKVQVYHTGKWHHFFVQFSGDTLR